MHQQTKKGMKEFEVKMVERGRDGKIRTLHQHAWCVSEEELIKWYGLNEPDIISYEIKEIEK